MSFNAEQTQGWGGGRTRVRWLTLGLLVLAVPAALARINVVTLPGRDSMQLTS